MRQRQPQHQGPQHLRLAGPGRADDQSVWTHALLGRLFDVQVDRCPVGAHPDRDPQPIPRGTRPPRLREAHRGDVANPEQVGQLRGRGERVLAGGSFTGIQRSKSAREGLGPRDAELIGIPADGFLAHHHGGGLDAVAVVGGFEVETQAGVVVEFVPPIWQIDHGDTLNALVGDDRVTGRDHHVVEDEDDVRSRHCPGWREPRPLVQIRRQEVDEFVEARAHEPTRPSGVIGDPALSMW